MDQHLLEWWVEYTDYLHYNFLQMLLFDSSEGLLTAQSVSLKLFCHNLDSFLSYLEKGNQIFRSMFMFLRTNTLNSLWIVARIRTTLTLK